MNTHTTAAFLIISLMSATLGRGQDAVRIVTLSDGESPVPCRIHLKDAQQKPVVAPNLPFWRDHFSCNGDVALKLSPGAYTFQVERGPEFSSISKSFTFTNQPLVITNRFTRIAHLANEGWWSGDLHVQRAPADMPLLMRAEDLHVAPVITWANRPNRWNSEIPSKLLNQVDDDRFFRVMAGKEERAGGALLYFNLNQPLDIRGARREYPSSMKFLAEAHKNTNVWVDIEKPFWYDTPLWLASGMVNSIGICHNHMLRSGMYPDEAWGKPRNLRRFPTPRDNGFYSQEIYYHILNTGLRIHPSAGSCSGGLPNPLGYNRMYVKLDGPLTYEKWWQGFREGRVFVSNGPLPRVHANEKWPGHVFKFDKELTVKLDGRIDSRDPISKIEVIHNGNVVRSIPPSASLGELKFTESGWFLVRVIADVPETFRFASTGPFYLERNDEPTRVSKTSAQFFLDWERERIEKVKIDDQAELDEVLRYHRDAEKFWETKLMQANAE